MKSYFNYEKLVKTYVAKNVYNETKSKSNIFLHKNIHISYGHKI